MNNLEIYKLKKNYKISEKELRKILKKACRLLKLKNCQISLAFVGDKEIRDLNKKYRFRDKATDVLSFGLSKNWLKDVATGFQPALQRNLKGCGYNFSSGEIIISYPEAKRQSKSYQESLQKVIERLFAHGLLHLAGYEHKTKKDRKKMDKIQSKLL